MGFFDFIKKKKKSEGKDALITIKGQDWWTPLYSQFGSNIYKSIVVQQAINCIVREIKKLQPQHIIKKENSIQGIDDDLQKVLDNPNPLMTTTDFLEKITWQLYFNYNSFILPTYKDGKLLTLYPLQPTNVLFLQDNSNEIFVNLSFANNYECVVNYNDLIHLKYNYSTSEFMGGDKNGQPDNQALLDTLKLNDALLKGVAKALNSSYAINGIVKYNSLLDGGKTEAALKELETHLNNSENGFLPLDLKGEFIPFSKNIQLVDQDTLDFVDSQILRFFGVPLCILKGDYTKAQYEAFYQKTIEPLVITYEQAFTKALFSNKQRFGFGHKIRFNHKELEFMTTAEKIQWMTLASNVGAITINEMRQIIGYPIYEDEVLGNTPIMSKNFGDALVVKDVDKSIVDNANNIVKEGENGST